MEQAKIIFVNDNQFSNIDHLKEFMGHSSGSFDLTLYGDKILVIIKEIPSNKQSYEKVRMVAGDISRELGKRKVKNASIDGQQLIDALSSLEHQLIVTAFVEGWHLGAYKFVTYKSKDKMFLTNLNFETDEKIQPAIHTGEIRAEAVAFSRDLMNEVPNALTPETFPTILESTFSGTDVKVNILDEARLKELEMNGLLSVCRGSKYTPAFVELTYCSDASKPLVALIGKGVTFDTGGISLKGGRDLSDMRMDMGGAAAVAGAMKLLSTSQANVNVVALIPVVENMPDRHSLLPGEVIHYKNGHTVQVGNTDAEGRLILADGLIRAGELNAGYVVDIATLTGAIARALGSKFAGVFGDENLSVQMKNIGDQNGDFIWPMPLVDEYESYLKSDYADFSNISSKGEAGSITAALFLRRFVPKNCKWLHVDMAGVMESSEGGYYTNSATGYGARLLADFTEHVSK